MCLANTLLKTMTSIYDYDIKERCPKLLFFSFQICPTVGSDKNELQGDGFCRTQQSSSNAVSIWFSTHQYLGV